MAIEDAIKTQWGNDSTLNGLIASTSVSVGDVLGTEGDEFPDPTDDLPRARLSVISNGFINGNLANYEEHEITVLTTCGSNSEANSIRAALHDAFRNKTWTANGHAVELAQVTGTDKRQQEDSGNWQLETTIITRSVEV